MPGGPRNVLILGCGRSGTSILGELFETLPGWTYLSEPFVDDIPSGAERTAVKVPRPGPADPGGVLDVGPVLDRLGDPVVLWPVRHPLDAVCSLRPGIGDGWDHHPRPSDWQDWIDRPLVERCAHHWATVNGPRFDAVADRAVVSRFEAMVGDPRRHADWVVAHAGVDPVADAAAISAWAARVQDTDNERFVEARTSRRHSRPDHTVRVGRWRENLTTAEVAEIVPIVAAAATRFGYELPPSSPGSAPPPGAG